MKHPQNDWVPAFTTNQMYLAEVAMNLLGNADIESYMINKADSVLLVGDIEIYVKQDVLLRAKYLLKELED